MDDEIRNESPRFTPGRADAYNYKLIQKRAPTMPDFVLGSLTKAEKGQRNSFGPTLGLSLTTYAYFAIIEGFFLPAFLLPL